MLSLQSCRAASGALTIRMMKATLIALMVSAALALAGCGPDSEVFPNAPNLTFIRNDIGPGPIPPTGPVSGHTTANPTGER